MSSFSDTLRIVIHNEYFTVFDTSRIWVFEDIYVFDAIWVYISSKNLHT